MNEIPQFLIWKDTLNTLVVKVQNNSKYLTHQTGPQHQHHTSLGTVGSVFCAYSC